MSKPKIVIVGSANMDMVIKTDRLPSKGETVLGGNFVTAPGGKGANQAVAAAKLGAQVTFVARLGTDIFGDKLINSFNKVDIDTHFIVHDTDHPSGIALIFVDSNGDNMIAVAPGANDMLSEEDILKAEPAIASADILLTELEIPINTVKYAVKVAKKHQVQVILNPAPAKKLDKELLAEIDVLTPNESELEFLTTSKISAEYSIETAATSLLRDGVKNVVVTLGDRGSLIVTKVQSKTIPTKRVKVVDTTAAGDAFNGALAFALASGQDLEHAVRFANCVGALTATKLGAQPSLPTMDEVSEFLKSSAEVEWPI
ncbi:MAG TPA: ribokinase [bacterium (Candidatus Stahlbacteria)]|nr:ribokinase [Candidatus Stahlbacteria bacterium]